MTQLKVNGNILFTNLIFKLYEIKSKIIRTISIISLPDIKPINTLLYGIMCIPIIKFTKNELEKIYN
jgi:hypothetical protein